MKTLSTLIYLCLVTVFCAAQSQPSTGMVIISGKLKNADEASAVFKGETGLVRHQINIVDNSFIDTVEVTTGYYMLGFSKEYASLYIEPGFNINVEIDMKQFDESITFTGHGAVENNFLANFYLESEKHNKSFAGKPDIAEAEFVSASRDFIQSEVSRLNQCIECSPLFRQLHEQFLKINHSMELFNFAFMKTMMLKSKELYVVSDSFPDPFEGIDFNNSELIVIPGFSFVVQNKCNPVVGIKMKADATQEYHRVLILVVDSIIDNVTVKEKVIFDVAGFAIDRSGNKENMYELIMSKLVTEAYKDRVAKHYLKWTNLKKGLPSPDFEFKTISGDSYRLSDFRGKYIYIDIWATWCTPCIAELPELRKLIAGCKEKPIQFVSIAWEDNRKNWETKIKEDDLLGIQLFAEDSKHSFFQNYIVNSIPRFILLDPQGNIVDPYAMRPSNPELKPYLDSLLN